MITLLLSLFACDGSFPSGTGCPDPVASASPAISRGGWGFVTWDESDHQPDPNEEPPCDEDGLMGAPIERDLYVFARIDLEQEEYPSIEDALGWTASDASTGLWELTLEDGEYSVLVSEPYEAGTDWFCNDFNGAGGTRWPCGLTVEGGLSRLDIVVDYLSEW